MNRLIHYAYAGIKLINLILMFLFSFQLSHAQSERVGIGNTTPAAKLDIRGSAADPTVPSATSTGVLRIGVGANVGIDIGKIGSTPFAGWIQSGSNGNPEPLSLQPIGGNVGVGTTNPVTKLNISGTAGSPSIPGTSSTGILRIGVSAIEAVDVGKMQVAPFSAWLQVGYQGNVTDPLALQPLGGNVGIGTAAPDPSAALDINSTSKGFLPPRMTFAERNSIATPVEGLVVWCKNCGAYGQLQVFNGLKWTNLLGGIALGLPAVGDFDGGGIIAYLLQAGDPGYVAGEIHGLIAAPADLGTAEWGCHGSALPGADAEAIGQGNQNTIDIVNGCSTSGIAAKLCSDLVLNGYNDWYLPSKNELNRLYNNRVAIGGFLVDFYWTSTEYSTIWAWDQHFSNGNQSPAGNKTFTSRIRPIRSF